MSDLRFQTGLEFEDRIMKNLGLPVNYIEGNSGKEFLLVAQFSRSKIRLNHDSVGLILQACFGGKGSRFKVIFLGDHCFRFLVS